MTSRRALLVLALLAATAPACSATFDLAYLAGDGHTSSTVHQIEPTGIDEPVDVYTPALAPDGTLSLRCEHGERPVQRELDETKIYRYEGGYEPATYSATAVFDGMVGGISTALVGASCLRGRISCTWLAATTPFVASAIWGFLRHYTVDQPTLVDKQFGPAATTYGAPTALAPEACPAGLRLAVDAGDARAADVAVATDGSVTPDDVARVAQGVATSWQAQLVAEQQAASEQATQGGSDSADTSADPSVVLRPVAARPSEGDPVPLELSDAEACLLLRSRVATATLPATANACLRAGTPPPPLR